MAKETSKALLRRREEMDRREFDWSFLFKPGQKILDIGAGDDAVPGSKDFDLKDGDANMISNYFKKDEFDVVHGSHVAEHLFDPAFSIRDWFHIVKPGGHIVITVPDIGAYERFEYPSKFNPDHKASFSLIYRGSPFPVHCYLPEFVHIFDDIAECLLVRYVEQNYNWKLPRETDQTWKPEDRVEIWNECVWRKK